MDLEERLLAALSASRSHLPGDQPPDTPGQLIDKKSAKQLEDELD
jgi:hypothetical protein